MKRKITSILAADVVEFSRLVAEDEEDTLARLVSAQAVFGAHVSSHGGRIFNTAGDAILAEFPSAVEAVRAALAIQDGWRAVDGDAPDGRRLWFRMGLGIGDVVEHGADLLGDGVNIAARLQGLAPAGGIALSHWVCEQIAGKINLPMIDMGEQELKNIPKPVRVSVIDLAGQWPQVPPQALTITLAQAAWAKHTAPARLSTTRTLVGGAAALLVVVSALIVLRPKRPQMVVAPVPAVVVSPAPTTVLSPSIVAPPPVSPPHVSPPPELAGVPAVAPVVVPVVVPEPVPVSLPPAAPPVIIDPPDFATPAAKPTVVEAPAAVPIPGTVPPPQPETTEPKRMPIRPPEPKRLPSIEKKPAAK